MFYKAPKAVPGPTVQEHPCELQQGSVTEHCTITGLSSHRQVSACLIGDWFTPLQVKIFNSSILESPSRSRGPKGVKHQKSIVLSQSSGSKEAASERLSSLTTLSWHLTAHLTAQVLSMLINPQNHRTPQFLRYSHQTMQQCCLRSAYQCTI